MKQLLILSGKGGTGKTTVAGAFIKISQAKAYADCDVDAPNLHLLMSQHVNPEQKDFYGLDKAIINQESCAACGLCAQYCRFDAIQKNGKVYQVDSFACEGCGLCDEICPVKAISMTPCVVGNLKMYKAKDVFSTAQLKMGNGNSGLLVSEVKKQMKNNKPENTHLAVIDGSPGIGCPVIASLSGVDMVLIVTEPSLSGMSDLDRIVKTTHKLQVKPAVCINKYDTNQQISNKIKDYCEKEGILFTGMIPYDNMVIKAVNQGRSIMDYECEAREAIKKVYQNTIKHIELTEEK
ncbi:MAG TPA: ATP-binding protein [Candidatus Cloacimonadota bacterium]|jgi:MinD superfamily P-loop ATPase|nr:ATP-binding protein [Candidatus Cloacimonadota bacterium]